MSKAGVRCVDTRVAPHLGSSCADVLHVLNAAHTVVGHLAAGQSDVVPEAPLPI